MTVGIFDGLELEGHSVGQAVGSLPEGASVGDMDNDWIGAAVGHGVGLPVGWLVGNVVIRGVGSDVGWLLGKPVICESVGVSVGMEVEG